MISVFLKSTFLSQTIGQLSIIQHLQQNIVNIRMRFFNFIQQDHAIWFASYFFCQLSAFFITNISRRRTDQTAYGKFLHVFTHIDPDQRIF